MARIEIDPGPAQRSIAKADIQEMILRRPRRMKLAVEWRQALHEPQDVGRDWSMVLPFCETYQNAFEAMCFVPCNPLRRVKNDRCQTFFRDATDDDLEDVRRWLVLVGAHVGLRDCLALSFALDYECEDGDPEKPQTPMGRLRARAKTYGGEPTPDTYPAADALVAECTAFMDRMTCYRCATCVVGMPPSKPGRTYDLTRYLAEGISRRVGLPDRTEGVRTARERPSVRTLPLEKKLAALEGTIAVDSDAVRDENVLLIEDLYQSGVSMNYVGMLLVEAGARRVLGLACEKTCTNDDNVSRRARR